MTQFLTFAPTKSREMRCPVLQVSTRELSVLRGWIIFKATQRIAELVCEEENV